MKFDIDNITKEEVVYDLKRHMSHARDIYHGRLKGVGLSKEGAFRRMQVYNYAINNLTQD
jgi:hypothetical protein